MMYLIYSKNEEYKNENHLSMVLQALREHKLYGKLRNLIYEKKIIIRVTLFHEKEYLWIQKRLRL